MKVAMYFSGRIQNEKHKMNREHLQMFNNKYDMTYFCSLNKQANDEIFINKFCSEFNISEDRINVEEISVPEVDSKITIEGNINNMYSMFYHNYKAMELIKNFQDKHNTTFDAVIKYRADIYSQDIINIENNIDNDTVFIPVGSDWGGVNDQVAYGNFNSMYKYSSCFLKFHKYAEFYNVFHPETILKLHLIMNNLKENRFNYNYKLNK